MSEEIIDSSWLQNQFAFVTGNFAPPAITLQLKAILNSNPCGRLPRPIQTKRNCPLSYTGMHKVLVKQNRRVVNESEINIQIQILKEKILPEEKITINIWKG